MPTKNRAELIEMIWTFVQKEEETIPEEMQTSKNEVEEAVVEMDGELRISGETGNNFSDFYVNYHDGGETAGELLRYLAGKGFEADWYNPGYMVVGGQ